MPDIHHALIIGATAENIYNAISSQKGLSRWWTPEASAKAELNSIIRFPFDPDYYKEMKIVQLKPFELVEWNCIKGADEWIGTNISFQIIAGDKKKLLNSYPEMKGQLEQQVTDKRSLLIFHHNDWKEYTLMFAECNYTWGQFLRSLKLLCETGEGRPWPNQHEVKS